MPGYQQSGEHYGHDYVTMGGGVALNARMLRSLMAGIVATGADGAGGGAGSNSGISSGGSSSGGSRGGGSGGGSGASSFSTTGSDVASSASASASSSSPAAATCCACHAHDEPDDMRLGMWVTRGLKQVGGWVSGCEGD